MSLKLKSFLKASTFVVFIAAAIYFIVLAQTHAAVPLTGGVQTPPTTKRVLTIVIHNGQWEYQDYVVTPAVMEGGVEVTPAVMGKHLVNTSAPYVEVVAVGCDPIKDAEGNFVLNAFGEKTYKDNMKWIGSKKLTDPALLAPYIASIWQPLMTQADAELTNIDVTPK